jgi:hypothetical protein
MANDIKYGDGGASVRELPEHRPHQHKLSDDADLAGVSLLQPHRVPKHSLYIVCAGICRRRSMTQAG